MNQLPSIAVALAAEKEYTQALKTLAARRNCRVADLTRAALDKVYGDEISAEINRQKSFFDADVARVQSLCLE